MRTRAALLALLLLALGVVPLAAQAPTQTTPATADQCITLEDFARGIAELAETLQLDDSGGPRYWRARMASAGQPEAA